MITSTMGKPLDELRGERVLLRGWRPEDREPFAALNADPEVMRHFPKLLDRAESDAMADRIEACFETQGFGLWALEIPGKIPFAGFSGLWPAHPEVPCAPAIEIGWRLARTAWGHGYATESAKLALAYGFFQAGLDSIVSFTAVTNTRSQAVMKRLGLQFEETFEHSRARACRPSAPPPCALSNLSGGMASGERHGLTPARSGDRAYMKASACRPGALTRRNREAE